MKYHFLVPLALLSIVFGIITPVKADPIGDKSDSAITGTDRNPVDAASQVIVNPPRFNHVMDGLELAIYNRVNLYRMSLDLPPLIIDPAISAQAKAHSEAMAKIGGMNHDGFNDRLQSISQTITYRSAGENVATNFGHNQPDVMAIAGWIDSPGHHRHLIGRYDLTGIGIAQDAKGEYYFTQIFIRRQK